VDLVTSREYLEHRSRLRDPRPELKLTPTEPQACFLQTPEQQLEISHHAPNYRRQDVSAYEEDDVSCASKSLPCHMLLKKETDNVCVYRRRTRAVRYFIPLRSGPY
jgi:hypothetical protein